MNDFMVNHSKQGGGHTDYIFGKKDDKYKSFGLTHKQKDGYPTFLLNVNPDPNDSEKAYIHKKARTTHERYMVKDRRNLSFDSSDLSLIRHMKKGYKKMILTERRQRRKKKKDE